MLTATAADQTLIFAGPWESLTLSQFAAAVTAQASSDLWGMLLAVCSHPDLLDQLPDPHAERELAARLPWLFEPPPDFASWPVPDVLMLDGKPIPLPGNLGLETCGQMKAAESLSGPILDVYRGLLAIYLCPALTGLPFRYQLTDLTDTLSMVDRLPVRDAVPLAAFFLRKSETTPSSGRVIYRSQSTTRTGKSGNKLLRRFVNWLAIRPTL